MLKTEYVHIDSALNLNKSIIKEIALFGPKLEHLQIINLGYNNIESI